MPQNYVRNFLEKIWVWRRDTAQPLFFHPYLPKSPKPLNPSFYLAIFKTRTWERQRRERKRKQQFQAA